METVLKILLIIIFFIQNGAPEIDDKKHSRDVSDYDLQEKDYQSLPAKGQGHALLENDYRKLGLTTDNINIDQKLAYIPQHKCHLRHNRNATIKQKRRIENMENDIFEYPELRNMLENNVQALKAQKLDNEGELSVEVPVDEGTDIEKQLPIMKYGTLKRRPLRKLRKFYAPLESSRITSSDDRQVGNAENTCVFADESKERGNINVGSGGFVLTPEKNRVILLKNISISSVNPKTGDSVEQSAGRSLLLSIKTINPQNNELSKEKETVGGSPSQQQLEYESDKSEGIEKMVQNEPYQLIDANANDELKSRLKQEILNCTNAGLEKYLKLIGGKTPKTAAFSSEGIDRLSGDKSDLMNLNITINGLVINNDMPSKIHGNGTIKLNPGFNEDERNRRAINLPFLKRFSKQKETLDDEDRDEDSEAEKLEDKKECKPIKMCKPKGGKKKCPIKEEPRSETIVTNPDAGLTPDKLSNEIVKMVSHMVRSNPKMKTLWPSLKRNRPMSKGAACNLRTTANCSGRKQIEDMLRKAMCSVNDIIEKEVQSRSCVPLSEDLAEFYEVILEMHAKQAKRKEEREEMLLQAEKLDNADMKSKKKPCKGKPKNKREGEPYADLEDNELYNMLHKRRVQYDKEIAEERRRREAARRTRELILDTSNSSLVRKLRELYSPAFLKLSSTVESLERSDVVPEQL